VAESAPAPAPATGDTAAQAQARAALIQALGNAETQTAATPTAAPAAAEPAAAPAADVATPPALQGSKAERLQQLLSQYKADQIAAQEYHEKRAAILAEP
jgi:hypothetical protein